MNTEQARFTWSSSRPHLGMSWTKDVLDLLYVVRAREFVPRHPGTWPLDLEIPPTPAAAHDAASSERMWQTQDGSARRPGTAAKKSDACSKSHRQRLADRLLSHRSQHVFSWKSIPPEARGAGPAEWAGDRQRHA